MTKKLLSVATFLICLFFCLGTNASAAVKLPAIISENMVLQAGKKVPIWGTGSPGEKVKVKFQNQTIETTADPSGNWKIYLRAIKTGGPYQLTITAATNTISLKNVMVGQVWLCAGQSNMEMELDGTKNDQYEIKQAHYPSIRFFRVIRQISPTPLNQCQGKWEICNSPSAASFSAVGYYFGRKLHSELHCPIGLIEAAYGGTPAQSWTSKEALLKEPTLKYIYERWDKVLADFRTHLPAWYLYQLKRHHYPIPATQNGQLSVPPLIVEQCIINYSGFHPLAPSNLFNGMINPLIPYELAGVIWYQGESNVGHAKEYKILFATLIADWRARWQKELPFIFVQLPNYNKIAPELPPDSWARLREAQLESLAVPKTAMAVTIDVGEANNVHPRNKKPVGERLALAALAKVYDKNLEYSGPLFKSMAIEKNRAIISFSHLDGGLAVSKGSNLTGFSIAGANKQFYPAAARIEQDKVIVFSKEVPDPISVRYAWANNPECNLINKANLPASPFRTDRWPAQFSETLLQYSF